MKVVHVAPSQQELIVESKFAEEVATVMRRRHRRGPESDRTSSSPSVAVRSNGRVVSRAPGIRRCRVGSWECAHSHRVEEETCQAHRPDPRRASPRASVQSG